MASPSYTDKPKPDGKTGVERQAERFAAKADANEAFYRGIPRIGAPALYEGDLRQFRRREDRKAEKRAASQDRQAAIKARRQRKVPA